MRAIYRAGMRGHVDGTARRTFSMASRTANQSSRAGYLPTTTSRCRATVEGWVESVGSSPGLRGNFLFHHPRPNAIQFRSFRRARLTNVTMRTGKDAEDGQQYSGDEKQKRQRRQKLRMRNLHRSAKMKRILCACDFWFGVGNLATDDFLKEELRDYGGHVPLSTLASFPKLEHWGDDPRLIYETLTCGAARRRYGVVFNREIFGVVGRNRRRARVRRRRGVLHFLEGLEEMDLGDSKEAAKKIRLVLEKDPIEDDFGKEDCMYDEELPPIVDDASANLEFALVRPKKVKPHYYTESHDATTLPNDEGREEGGESVPGELEEGTPSEREAERGLKRHASKDATTPSDDGGNGGGRGSIPNEPGESQKAKKGKRKRYFSNRQWHVITDTKQLASFCDELKSSIDSSPSSRSAVGFDIEYCRLEDDLHENLPAMLTLASSDPEEGIVGLVWLDKFPNRGRGMIGDPDCECLLSLLDDAGVLKVGVGASKDARHLAAWWGVNDRSFTDHFFSGMVDIESALDNPKLARKSLQELCAAVLDRDLPKVKERDRRRKIRARMEGRRVKTSHWRREELTMDMKRYAADDASCAIDVWKKMQEMR